MSPTLVMEKRGLRPASHDPTWFISPSLELIIFSLHFAVPPRRQAGTAADSWGNPACDRDSAGTGEVGRCLREPGALGNSAVGLSLSCCLQWSTVSLDVTARHRWRQKTFLLLFQFVLVLEEIAHRSDDLFLMFSSWTRYWNVWYVYRCSCSVLLEQEPGWFTVVHLSHRELPMNIRGGCSQVNAGKHDPGVRSPQGSISSGGWRKNTFLSAYIKCRYTYSAQADGQCTHFGTISQWGAVRGIRDLKDLFGRRRQYWKSEKNTATELRWLYLDSFGFCSSVNALRPQTALAQGWEPARRFYGSLGPFSFCEYGEVIF